MVAKLPNNQYFTPVKKRTSIGNSSRSRPKNKNKRRQHVKYRGQGWEKVCTLTSQLKKPELKLVQVKKWKKLSKGAPTKANFTRAKQTARKK